MTICECTSVGEKCEILNNKCIALQSVWWVLEGGGQLSDPVGFGRMAQLQSAFDKLVFVWCHWMPPQSITVSPSLTNSFNLALQLYPAGSTRPSPPEKIIFSSIPGKVLFYNLV